MISPKEVVMHISGGQPTSVTLQPLVCKPAGWALKHTSYQSWDSVGSQSTPASLVGGVTTIPWLTPLAINQTDKTVIFHAYCLVLWKGTYCSPTPSFDLTPIEVWWSLLLPCYCHKCWLIPLSDQNQVPNPWIGGRSFVWLQSSPHIYVICMCTQYTHTHTLVQALIYPLTVATKSQSATRKDAAEMILKNMREHSSALVQQAIMVSEELIRVAILWHEQWHEGLEDASRWVEVRWCWGLFDSLTKNACVAVR